MDILRNPAKEKKIQMKEGKKFKRSSKLEPWEGNEMRL